MRAGWEIGLLPTMIPEEYGGLGDYSAVTGAVAIEALRLGRPGHDAAGACA